MDYTADDRGELVRLLLLEAGRLMEVASPDFALALADEHAIALRIEQLENIGTDLTAFAAASKALLRLCQR